MSLLAHAENPNSPRQSQSTPVNGVFLFPADLSAPSVFTGFLSRAVGTVAAIRTAASLANAATTDSALAKKTSKASVAIAVRRTCTDSKRTEATVGLVPVVTDSFRRKSTSFALRSKSLRSCSSKEEMLTKVGREQMSDDMDS